ncbi:MAG: helix-turn-helix transcriptional regulator [Bacteroidetes bacterium]|nr:helix-turn-helix transcriptional regulator [Bacteroidota bacterium]
MNENGLSTLTIREKEVLSILSNGSTNKETAEKLNISVRTVETHRKNIMQKLNIKNIAGLIKFSIANNLTFLD